MRTLIPIRREEILLKKSRSIISGGKEWLAQVKGILWDRKSVWRFIKTPLRTNQIRLRRKMGSEGNRTTSRCHNDSKLSVLRNKKHKWCRYIKIIKNKNGSYERKTGVWWSCNTIVSEIDYWLWGNRFESSNHKKTWPMGLFTEMIHLTPPPPFNWKYIIIKKRQQWKW